MSTISILETSTGQEETAILLEEYERRIATLQESLKQAGRIHPNEAVIMQERDDLRRRLENAELLIERLKAREIKLKQFESSERCANKLWREAHDGRDFWPGKTGLLMWLMEQIDNTTAKQPDDSSNTDGDGDSVIDDNHLQVELDCEALRELIEKKLSQRVENIKKAISSPTLSPELAALGRELVRLAEKSLGEVEG